jgi:HlyD family secretion protein
MVKDSKTIEETREPPPDLRLPERGGLPALRPEAPRPRSLSWLRLIGAFVLLGALGAGALYWWQTAQTRLPSGIVFGNGRIEAEEIDIDTKFAGRVAAILADEGDTVKAGQVVARMDTRDLEVSLDKAKAQVRQAQRSLEEAKANLQQQQTQVTLAKQQLDRARFLVPKGYATQELLDMRQQQMNAAMAAFNAANARVGMATLALEAATHDVALLEVNIADNTLVAPKDGRIQYRLANVGEVLPAGGKVFTALDTSYVYMDVFLPTLQAGRVGPGAEARIVLDSLPQAPLAAKVTFVADQAQFTPKAVETETERDRLMFRVRLRIDPAALGKGQNMARAGLPGMGYVKIDPQQVWPPSLQAK